MSAEERSVVNDEVMDVLARFTTSYREAAEALAAANLLATPPTASHGETALHRDLVKRLGFGDNITEPMADNDTIVAWFEEQGRDASEWREHELWRGDCYAAGHPDDEDCDEHGPTCCHRPHLAARAAAGADMAGES